jgi:hypothetical protein
MRFTIAKKGRAALYLVLSLVLMLVGVEALLDFYDGADEIPKTVQYGYILLSLSIAGVAFAHFAEVFKSDK